ncbi:MAG: IPT/TIG domain-containing protein, partial [bacterium]|nr:IPT/TIG domain-containing protein [bacterium]
VFTHSYSRAGTYTPTFTVANTNGQSAQTSLSVNVGGVIPTSSITVTSPQAGETWRVGETYKILWNSNDPTMLPMASRVSITLNSPYPACLDSVPACSIPIRSPYTIAKDASDSGSYTWTIPVDLPDAYRGAAQITVARTSAPAALGRSGTFEISRIIQPPTSTVWLDSLQPGTGPVGTTVTVTGSGFTPTGNDIHFAEGGIRGVSFSNNGTTLTFKVPSSVSGCDFWTSSFSCTQPARLVAPGTYTIYVANANGTSNEAQFTVSSGLGATPQGDIVAGVATRPSRETLLASLSAITERLSVLIGQLK